jgi:glycosyltransferase involved in cell wall biosynthesis
LPSPVIRPPLKLVHIITGLNTGGAETMLLKLLRHGDRARVDPVVISLRDKGHIGPEIEQLGIPVLALNLRGVSLRPLFKLHKLLKILQPEVVQTWMYHADLIGGLAARAAGVRAIAWNLRQSVLRRDALKLPTYLIAHACARLSGSLPQAIVSCSQRAADAHQAFGYHGERMQVIPNGFELERFQPDGAARASLRAELALDEAAPLVGLIARFDPQKDHRSFIIAAQQVHAKLPQCRFLLCGDDIVPSNRRLEVWLQEAGIGAACHLLGRRADMPRITAALDVAVSASAYGEGFANSIGEAMACAVPCVATDVGDSALLIGDSGTVVQPSKPDDLAKAIHALLSLPLPQRQQLGSRARAQIENTYSMPRIARRYLDLYAVLAQG